MTDVTLARSYVADTVALILRIERRIMDPRAEAIFSGAEAGTTTVYIPAMVFAEIMYLGERKRISMTLHDAEEYIGRFPAFQQYPLDLAVLQAAAQIDDIPELHDRLIAGTAKLLKLELVTNDLKMRASTFIQTIW